MAILIDLWEKEDLYKYIFIHLFSKGDDWLIFIFIYSSRLATVTSLFYAQNVKNTFVFPFLLLPGTI